MNNCIICFEDMNNTNLVVLECCHKFHTECIITLIKKRNRKCPICRTRIKWNVPQLLKHISLTKDKFGECQVLMEVNI